MLFQLNLFKNLNLCTSYIKQIMNVFSFMQWNKYFHSVKDEMYLSSRLRLVEWNISSFTSWKYLYHCTHKHYLYTGTCFSDSHLSQSAWRTLGCFFFFVFCFCFCFCFYFFLSVIQILQHNFVLQSYENWIVFSNCCVVSIGRFNYLNLNSNFFVWILSSFPLLLCAKVKWAFQILAFFKLFIFVFILLNLSWLYKLPWKLKAYSVIFKDSEVSVIFIFIFIQSIRSLPSCAYFHITIPREKG